MSEHHEHVSVGEAGQLVPPFLPPPFDCACHFRGPGPARVRASGELDIVGAVRLEQALRNGLACSSLMVLDLHQLEFIDSAGMHVILEATARARLAGRRLLLTRPPRHVTRAFAVTGTSGRVDVEDLGLHPMGDVATQPAAAAS